MVVDSLTSASQGPTGEALSPELVLVSPELRAEALRRLPSLEAFAAARVAPVGPTSPSGPGEPVFASAWQALLGRIEVSAQVPVLLMLVLWAAVAILRVMVLIGGPIVMAVAVVALLGY
jgi:hypothetical protein